MSSTIFTHPPFTDHVTTLKMTTISVIPVMLARLPHICPPPFYPSFALLPDHDTFLAPAKLPIGYSNQTLYIL
jgi:hypothetical protein